MKDDFDWIVTQLREAEKDDGWPPWAVLGVWAAAWLRLPRCVAAAGPRGAGGDEVTPLRRYWYSASVLYWRLGGDMPTDGMFPSIEREAADLERHMALMDWLRHDSEVSA